MKKILAILGILIVLFVAYVWFFYFSGRKNHNSGPKPVPIAVSKHTDVFNSSMDNVLNAYYSMTEGFVNWDTNAVSRYGGQLVAALDSVKTGELQKDTARDANKIYLTAIDFIANAKGDATTIVQHPSWDKKRESLNILTDNLRNLFITVKYDKAKIYYQECPMAFSEDIPGYWLSKTDIVRNPYMGTMHPKHGDSMLSCGAPKDSIDFVVQDTTKLKN